ncbi:hypothetical protein QEJ31_14635 [Pigmentibacter sp. JX0631]|uniref:hypothetical protein n=1 Tax=Pigmentibacter sp. JX0631 TaxID=2976982 RepID=UPI00246935AA|nr:hypothetical protein [Pigmentibacter sp. JX0631]WGL59766.1 hypothetical protein QEJ31_14635 [Pigmentibacter sp. JX0631]
MRKLLEFENWKRFLISNNVNEVIYFKNNINYKDQIVGKGNGEIYTIEKNTVVRLSFSYFPLPSLCMKLMEQK